MFVLRRLSAAVATVGAFGASSNAFALWDDRLGLFASETVTRDDNVFRLSDSIDPTPQLGTRSPADTYRTTSFGFNLDVPAGRQRLTSSVALNRQRYERFTALDLDGHDGHALWHWQAGNALAGEAGYQDRRTLASLANVQSGIQSSTANFVRTKNSLFTATYGAASLFRLRGEIGRAEQINSVAEREINDIRVDAAEVVVSYVSRADNQLGVSVRVAHGQPSQPVQVGTLFVDNAYRQRHVAGVLAWTPTGNMRITARAGRIRRAYEQLPERDFSGSMYNVRADWQATGKLVLSAIAQRDISATEEINVGFVLSEGISFMPTWRVTEAITLVAGYERADREYLGDPGLVLGSVAPRAERMRTSSARLAWRPLKLLLFSAGWRRETRTSSAAFSDFEANIYSFGARVAF